MFMKMESLLDKVQNIEDEIADRLVKVSEEHNIKIGDLRAAEGTVIEDVREQAEKRGDRIVKEHISAAAEEINSLRQDEVRSVASVHETAKEHRKEAIDKAVESFRNMFVNG